MAPVWRSRRRYWAAHGRREAFGVNFSTKPGAEAQLGNARGAAQPPECRAFGRSARRGGKRDAEVQREAEGRTAVARWQSGADGRTAHVHVGAVMLTGGDEGRVGEQRQVHVGAVALSSRLELAAGAQLRRNALALRRRL